MDTPAQPVQPPNVQTHSSYKTPLILICFLVLSLVALTAVLLVQSSNSKLIIRTPQSNTVHPSPTSSNPTANWKTYTNSKKGIQFKYPVFLYVKTSSKYPDSIFVLADDIDIDSASEGPFSDLTISVERSNTTPIDFDKFKRTLHNPLDENVVIDGINERRISGTMKGYLEGTFTSEAIVSKDGKRVRFDYYEIEPNRFDRELFNQILQTFKFTP